MSNSSHSHQVDCLVCGRLHDQTNLLPCFHDGLCLDCIRRLSKPRCPFCRRMIYSVRTEDGEEAYSVLRSEYVAVEKRDLEKTVQIALVGPNVQDSQALLDVLLENGQHNSANRERDTNYSANCSFHNSESRVTVQPIPHRIRFWSNVDDLEADVIAIIVNGVDETTLEKFRSCHYKVVEEIAASVVWLLKHDDNSLSGCTGETIDELLESSSGPSFREDVSKLFFPLVKAGGNKKWTRDEVGDIYAFLWDAGKFHKMKKYLWTRA